MSNGGFNRCRSLSGPLTGHPYAFSRAARHGTFPHKAVSAEPTVRAGGIQEHPLPYSALLVPAILLVPANRADGSSQPRASDYGRRTYRRSVSCLETQLITVTYPVLMPENVLHFEGSPVAACTIAPASSAPIPWCRDIRRAPPGAVVAASR